VGRVAFATAQARWTVKVESSASPTTSSNAGCPISRVFCEKWGSFGRPEGGPHQIDVLSMPFRLAAPKPFASCNRETDALVRSSCAFPNCHRMHGIV
jgi:hypothetical protein